jgi:hypothetical protein
MYFRHGETPSKEQTEAFIQLCARFNNQKPLEIIGIFYKYIIAITLFNKVM